jgi:hypothetical protein
MKKILVTESQLKRIIEHIDKDIYHETFSSAVQTARAAVEAKGYAVDENDWFNRVNTGPGRPKPGQTTRMSIGLLKNEKPQRKALHIQVYNMGKRYELNFYVL